MKVQRFKAILTTGNWPDNPEPLMRSETGEYVKHSDLVEALRQRDEARQEATDYRNADAETHGVEPTPLPWENDQILRPDEKENGNES